MNVTGASFDVHGCMKPVTCKVYEFSPCIPSETTEMPAGEISIDAEKFPRHALVVDDEPLIRWSVAESLGGLGMDVEQASDAAAALRMVTTAANPFEVIVLDLRLPDMKDLSLAGTLRQLLPRAKLILMTAFGSPDVRAEAACLGLEVLTKPFALEDLNRLAQAPGRRPA